jgi:wyosine [tRNA(Phe)-imidazoG37] synthetase (radical SAM superfamily)
MWKKNLKYVYGPVSSWRLGSSLGIDPLSDKEKICTFDCLYCQLGRTYKFANQREVFVSVDEIIDEIKSLQEISAKGGYASGVDYITFSGRGEPTLAKNLGEMIKAIRKIRKETIAVITNSSLMYMDDVVEDLLLADFVLAKLDAYSQESLETINRPIKQITFDMIVDSIKQFKSKYKGKLALQIMFIKENQKNAKEISEIAKEINPDEIQINTPLRPSQSKPLSKSEIDKIKEYFKDMNTISVYDTKIKKVEPISTEDTLKRRGKV